MKVEELERLALLLSGGTSTAGRSCTLSEEEADLLLQLVYTHQRIMGRRALATLRTDERFQLLFGGPGPAPAGEGCKFAPGEMVDHLRSGNAYEVIYTPDMCFIEQDAVPAYAYSSGGKVWVRPGTEMEDGRFETAKLRVKNGQI